MGNVVTQWNRFSITNKGLEMHQQAIATGATITFNYAKIGQGAPDNTANIPSMTDIVSVVEQVPVVRSVADGVTHCVGIRIDNATFKQPVLMTEIGLFASIGEDTPTLYGYTYATQGYDSIPAGSTSHYVWTVSIDTIISRAQSISFSYDGSKVYATEDEIDDLIQSCEANKNTLNSKADKSYVDSQLEGKADKSDIPSSLPANGGNADTVGGHPPSDFVLSTREGIEVQIQIPNNVDIPAWISQNAMAYKRYYTNSENIGLTNLPTADTGDWIWYYFDGINIIARSNLTNNVWITANINGEFRGWTLLNATKLPADGGNADTLGNIAPSGFLLAMASRKLTTSLNASGLIGTYYCEDRFTPDYPKDSSGNAYGQYGLLDVRIYGSIFYQTMMFENGTVIHRARIAAVGDWSSWQVLNNTTYSPGAGITISGTTISNSGVRSVATGGSNGTIAVNTNGTTANVAVKGLASAAYQAVQTAAGTIGLHRISSGSAEPTTANCPSGCWYGKHD